MVNQFADRVTVKLVYEADCWHKMFLDRIWNFDGLKMLLHSYFYFFLISVFIQLL